MHTIKRNYTVEEDTFIKKHYRDLFDDEIAYVLHRPASSITRRRQRLGCWYVQQELSAPLPDEIWVQIQDLPIGYQVSNKGRIKSKGKLLSLYIGSKGYVQWRIVNHSKGLAKSYKVHRLVAEHFLEIPTNYSMYHVHHKDHNPTNNSADNLQWLTPAEHIQMHC